MSVSIKYTFSCDAQLTSDARCRAWTDVRARTLTDAREDVRGRGWTASGDRNKCPKCKLARNPYAWAMPAEGDGS